MKEKNIVAVSGIIFIVLFILAIFIFTETAVRANLIMLAVLIITIPYSINKFFEVKKTKACEKEFPNFLRDLAESQRAGLTIIQAFHSVAKSEYGSLSKEIRKINNQLSWNVTLENALKDFAHRTRKSRVITRSLLVINQANKSGGSVEDTMDSLA